MKLTPKLGSPAAFGISIFAVGLVGWVLRFGSMPVLTFFLAWAVMGVSVLPIMSWLRRGESTMPIFELVSLSMGVHMGLGAVTQPNAIVIKSQVYDLDWKYVNQALFLSLMGIMAMVAAFSLFRRLWQRMVPVAIDLRVRPQSRQALIVVLLLVAMAVRAAGALGYVPPGALALLLRSQMFVAAILAAIFYYRFQDKKLTLRAAIVMLTIYLSMAGLETGMLETALVPLLAVFIVRTACLREVPISLAIGAMIGVLMLNSVKDQYRNRVWWGGEGATSAQRMKIWGESVAGLDPRNFFKSGGSDSGEGAGWRESLSRFSLVSRFAWVCTNTPSSIPFFLGESYLPFIYTPIPRVIWKNKPIISEAIDLLDFTYELKDYGSTASIGIGFIAEAYANFSWYGVIGVMALQGAFIALLDRLFNRPRSEGGAAIYVALLSFMFNGIGTSAVVIYGNLPILFFCCAVFLAPFCTKLLERDAAANVDRRRGPLTMPRRLSMGAGTPPPRMSTGAGPTR